MHCQDVSSFGNAPVKMCHLWAGGFVCVCSFFLFLPKMHCQDVSSFGNAPVKMCRLWARGLVCVCCVFFIIDVLNALLRCVVFRQCTCQDVSSLGKGLCVCVLSLLFQP